MNRSLRPIDAVLLVGALLALGVAFGFQAADRAPVGPPGPVSVADASVFLSDDPLVIEGYLVRRGNRTLLCERARCDGPRLAVRGLGDQLPPRGAVLLLGIVSGDRVVAARLGSQGHRSRF
jgi:hypothetical protein